jgi:hypothetical protein
MGKASAGRETHIARTYNSDFSHCARLEDESQPFVPSSSECNKADRTAVAENPSLKQSLNVTSP